MFTMLAHGSLGNWDEFIFGSVVVIFLIVMGLSWVRSRTIEPELPGEADSAEQGHTPDQSADHFRLD